VTAAAHPSAGDGPAPTPRLAAPGREASALAALAFVLSLGLGLYLNLRLGIVEGDAMSRVADAFYVLFSRDPHLGAIGFVWNPLPSLLALPLVALRPVLPALVTRGLAAVVVSSAFAALAARALVRLGARMGLGAGPRVAFALAWLANPLVLLYGANGMTDLMFLAAVLAALDGVAAYLAGEGVMALAGGGMWLAAAFLVRYEAAAAAAGLTLGLAVALVRRGRPRREVEGLLLVFAAPVVYAAFLWLFANWLIMKDPLYFALSPYGNASQIATGGYLTPALASAAHRLGGALAYAARRLLLFPPAAPALLVAPAVWLSGRRGDALPAAWLGLMAVPALECAFLYAGRLAGWDRFFLAYVPAGFVLAAWLVGQVPAGRRTAVGLAVAALLLAGDAGTLWALTTPLGHGDRAVVRAALAGERQHPFAEADAVDAYLDRQRDATVLADTFLAWAVVVRDAYPRRFVVTSDRDFASVLANPRGRVRYLLVPRPTGLGALDAVNRAYPRLWAGGVSWARLVRAFPGPDGFRLYSVRPAAP
jgi:hypothetical protein